MMEQLTLDALSTAFERVRENDGCAGADGVTLYHYAQSLERNLQQLLDSVARNAYRPFPLLQIRVQKKPNSDQARTLLVPAVRDRVLQTWAAHTLSRSFEEEFLECSFAYRPGRGVDRAIARISSLHQQGFRFVVDADITAFFDNIDHSRLLELLADRIDEPAFLALVHSWVSAESWDGHQVVPITRGVPQGSPLSPLLANLFLNEFDRHLAASGYRMVRYADDFLVLAASPDQASAALTFTAQSLEELDLALNQKKTHIVNFEQGFEFLGALFQGDAVWIRWRGDRPHTRLLSMAKPMPASIRRYYERPHSPTSMESALLHMAAADSPPVPHSARSPHLERSVSPVAYLYISEQGAILRKSGDRFLVEHDDETLLDIPYHQLECVMLFGNVQVTTQALGECLEKGVALSFFSRSGVYRGRLAPRQAGPIDLRLAQFTRHADPARALDQARRFVRSKIGNSLTVLERLRRNQGLGSESARSAFSAAVERLQSAVASLDQRDSIAAVSGDEGAAAAAYFDTLMLFNQSAFVWPGRRRHPATDPLNALLSLAYTFLVHELDGALEAAGLDAALGFLHQPDANRPSLALDCVEPFRAPVADRLVLGLVNKRIFTADDFSPGSTEQSLRLKPPAFKQFLAEYEKAMLGHSGAEGGYRRLLRQEVERFVDAFRHDQPFSPWALGAPEEPCNTSSATT